MYAVSYTHLDVYKRQSMYKRDIETDYLEEIRQNISFNKWFFGHYHDNRNVNAEEILIYEQIIRIV